MESLALVPPDVTLEAEYRAMLDECRVLGEEYYSTYLLRSVDDDFAQFVRRLELEELGMALPMGIVPQTTYWLFRDGRTIVGESRLRHHLTSVLEVEGGHIGYTIRPGERRKGYGTQILTLMLEKARARAIPRVLVTCNTENIGSAKIIQKNGGVFSGEDISPRSGKPVSRYWITIAGL
ncbi:MAG TPA: GNAT family N-acetyltransferase [Armatimonadota bacterium]|jgi:predicted acetyltransferase